KLPTAEQRDGDLKMVLKALSAFRRGEPGVTLPSEWDGLYGKIASEFNELSAQTARTSQRLKAVETATHGSSRVSRRLGDDKLTGFWQENVGCVNALLDEVELGVDRSRALLGGLADLKKG